MNRLERVVVALEQSTARADVHEPAAEGVH